MYTCTTCTCTRSTACTCTCTCIILTGNSSSNCLPCTGRRNDYEGGGGGKNK